MLLKYELKKLLISRMNLIAMAVGFIILGLTTVYPVLSESEYLSETEESIKGLAAIEYNQKKAEGQADYLTDDYAYEVIKDIQENGYDLSTDDGFFLAYDKYGDLLPYLGNSIKDIKDDSLWTDVITDLELEKYPSFYERRIERIDDYLNMDFSYGNFTEPEKEYWKNRAAKIATPYRWGDTFVPKHYQTVLALSFYLSFVIAVVLSGVFARERDDNTEGILLSTKKGQKEDLYAKIAAGMIIGVGYMILMFAIAFIWLFSELGAFGFDLPVQLIDNSICYCMNMKQFLILQFVISLVIMIFVSAFSCFLSALTKSGVATIAIMFVLLLGPAFIPFSKESNLLNHLNCLALVRVMDLREVLKQFFVFHIGGHIINLPTMSIIVYLSATVMCICGLRKVYIFWSVRK